MLMTGTTNATIVPKDGRISRLTSTRSTSKPFVVCSMNTKRYAGSKTSKTPVERLSPTVRPTSSGDGSHVPHEAPVKQIHRLRPVRPEVSTASKAEVRRSFTKPALAPDPGETRTRSKTSAPFSRLTRKDGSMSLRVTAPTKVEEKTKKDKDDGYLAPVKSTQLTTANEVPPRPHCVPRDRVPRPFVDATLASKGKQELIVKAVVRRSRNPAVKVAFDIRATRTRVHATAATLAVKNASVSEHRPRVPVTRNEGLTYHPVTYPDVNWSPRPSPDLSSFPSQSWTVDVKQAWTPTTVCNGETPTSIRGTEESGSSDIPDDRCGSFESNTISPLSSTVVSTPPNLDICASGVDNTLELGRLTKGPSVEVSPTECAAKIISRPRNSSTSTDALAKIIKQDQAGSTSKNSDVGNRARMTVRSAFEIARNLFSRSQPVSESTPETATVKTIRTGVSRVGKLFVPPLEKDTKASQNATIQIEIEMLRAQKKVAGTGVVDPRLERLRSLSAMAIVAKHRGSSLGRA